MSGPSATTRMIYVGNTLFGNFEANLCQAAIIITDGLAPGPINLRKIIGYRHVVKVDTNYVASRKIRCIVVNTNLLEMECCNPEVPTT